jgi:hypothetical protein
MFLHVTSAHHLTGHQIELEFNDGQTGVIDLADALDGPIFAPLREVDYFRQFQLEGLTLTWPNGADFAPEFLYEKLGCASV